jgi:Glycosyl transferases group 1/Methyltransferase domain
VRRLLHVGCGRGTLARNLKARQPRPQVYGIENDPEAAVEARTILDGVAATCQDAVAAQFSDEPFDAILLDHWPESREELASMVRALSLLLSPNGLFLLVCRNPGYWRVRTGLAPSVGLSPENSGQTVTSEGLCVLGSRCVEDPQVARCRPADDGALTVDGTLIPGARADDLPSLGTFGYVVVAVHPGYRPTAHAQALLRDGHPDWAYELLCLLPPDYLSDPAVAVAIAAQKQLCLLTQAGSAESSRRLELFWESQRQFYHAALINPDAPIPYRLQAEFWRCLGDEAMAARLLRTIEPDPPAPAPRCDFPWQASPPRYSAAEPRLRVLLLTDGRPNYGLDVLYDGLCTVLGDANVVEYPWKGSLHGRVPESFAQYPCLFDRPGDPLDADALETQLRDGRFDLILFGDIELGLDQEVARRLLAAGAGLPLFIVDQEDDPVDNRPKVLNHLGRDTVHGYFKREMLKCYDYGPGAWPLPFAYPDERVAEAFTAERNRPLFWAGSRAYGLRRRYLEPLASRYPIALDASYDQEAYAEALRTSRIGLNCFGLGFDTVRYWELPAHGCMLLSERPPIRIPHDFQDGETAVFFDDAPELEKRLSHYLAHPEEAKAIAEAGHGLLERHHTASARARQLLASLS